MGLLGIIVLSDHQQKSWLSRTAPAEYMRYLISINTGFLAIPFNGGMFGSIYLLDALRKHARARVTEAPRKLSRQERRHPENAKTK
ncbi:g7984 [Coccomyxa elongata]